VELGAFKTVLNRQVCLWREVWPLMLTQLRAPVSSDAPHHLCNFMLEGRGDACSKTVVRGITPIVPNRKCMHFFGYSVRGCTYTHHLLKIDKLPMKRLATLMEEGQI
jgi:hypothetical protein